jgi:hypothetical protein
MLGYFHDIKIIFFFQYRHHKSRRREKRGRGGRGVWGEFRRARAGSEAPPPVRSEQSRAEKSPFPFRRIFWWRAQIKICKGNFSARRAVLRHGGGAERLVSVRNFG